MSEPTKYRKRPVTIEAMQYKTPQVAGDIADWIEENGGEVSLDLLTDVLSIETLEGSMLARPGDYIIRGVQGEFYPCKPDIFEATYERADDA
ncbi:hypothetical protein ACFP47_09400 [Nesterenkonia lacusekhoensis]|uniref:Phage protein n=1 Tax=Nesterenkonia lacusekhoensis TaxID=150832 RepID=A0ABS4T042_9MICC|nr:hypothetical protein [Nesterenkonia lacusekhoensis]MBP2317364.1 hypothetical protein [Nesterenkonia lacusekhoensis]